MARRRSNLSTACAAVMAVLLLLAAPLSALATEWAREDVNTVAEKVRAGQGVDMGMDYPVDKTQSVWFTTPSFHYLIDIRAKLCFIRSIGGGITSVPCRALKEGYPLMAPIITWEK